MVRQGDEQWLNVVRWSLNAWVEAEEYGITSKNVDEMLNSSNPNVQRILGKTPGMGKNLGVDDKWAYSMIKQIGNYGESYVRTLGVNSPMKLERGLNAQWKQGGVMYAWSDVLGWDYVVGFMLATMILVMISYWGNKLIVFK